MYKVVVRFMDLQDENHVYNVGDTFPRAGKEVSDSRLEELSSNRNRRGVALIVNDTPEEASPEAEEGIVESKTGVNPAKTSEAKRRPRKGHEEHD